MDRTERFYRIDQLIHERRLVSFQLLLETLEVSRATLKRDLEYMRNRLNAPIVWDRDAGGYRFDKIDSQVGGQYELPGLWFNANEMYALLAMQHLLSNLGPNGILTPHVQPLMARINALLGTADSTADEIRKRIKIIGLNRRTLQIAPFESIGHALLRRKKLRITYYARGNSETTERVISPQRLIYYRENWYLDGFCELRNDLRSFAVDSIKRVEILEMKAKEISKKAMDEILGSGYGIFSGNDLKVARLRFTPQRARWVAQERWHSKQQGTFEPDGSYLLEFPYADHRELIMDILKFGADVEVLGPATLRKKVAEEGNRLVSLYADPPGAPSPE